MKELIKKEIIELLKDFISKKYDNAGSKTGISGNWSGNKEIVRSASLEEFLTFLESEINEPEKLCSNCGMSGVIDSVGRCWSSECVLK